MFLQDRKVLALYEEKMQLLRNDLEGEVEYMNKKIWYTESNNQSCNISVLQREKVIMYFTQTPQDTGTRQKKRGEADEEYLNHRIHLYDYHSHNQIKDISIKLKPSITSTLLSRYIHSPITNVIYEADDCCLLISNSKGIIFSNY